MAVALKPMIEIKLPDRPLLTLPDFDALPEGPAETITHYPMLRRAGSSLPTQVACPC